MKGFFRRTRLAPSLTVLSVAAVLLIVYFAVLQSAQITQACIENISRPLCGALGDMYALLPISGMELMYLFAGLWLVFHFVRGGIIVAGSISIRGKLKAIAARGIVLLTAIAVLLCAFCWLWGLDYRGKSFAEENGIVVSPTDSGQLQACAEYFIKMANELAVKMPRDESGAFAADKEEILASYSCAYEHAQEIFPSLQGKDRRPKAMIASKLMSYMGFTGIYFPLTGETNINVDVPGSLLALTVAHEMAHQRGIYAEDECNFLGVLACTSCENDIYRYAGYFGGLIYIMNELYDIDRDAWTQLCGEFSQELRQDWNENSTYWRAHSGKTEDAAGKIYDSYLKLNGQESGMVSYDECVGLIVTYFEPFYTAGGACK